MKTALITGSSRGIGAAIADVLAKDGWRVVLTGSRENAEARVRAQALGGEYIPAELSDETQTAALFDAVGDVDALVCCAGRAHYGLLQDMTDKQWQDLFSVNTDAVFRCCRAVIPGMVRKKAGCIVTVSSVWGVHGASCEAAYSASKAALIGLTKALAKELGPSGIRVNCVAPGVIDTDMISNLSAEDKAALAEETPLGRLGTPEDVAALVGFLCSARAGFLTGQIIGIDGGFAL